MTSFGGTALYLTSLYFNPAFPRYDSIAINQYFQYKYSSNLRSIFRLFQGNCLTYYSGRAKGIKSHLNPYIS